MLQTQDKEWDVDHPFTPYDGGQGTNATAMYFNGGYEWHPVYFQHRATRI